MACAAAHEMTPVKLGSVPLALLLTLACGDPTADPELATSSDGTGESGSGSGSDTGPNDADTRGSTDVADDGEALPDLGGGVGTCTPDELAALELEIADAFDAAAIDPDVTDDPNATLMLAADDGRRFVHSHGDSSATMVYESASTSKWVTAAIILDRVERGELTLDTTTSELLEFWPAPGVPLRNLLSFTSGFDDEAPCINLPGSDFATCVENIYEASLGDATAPGEAFYYSGSHMQIAGLMTIRASGAEDWSSIFADWQAQTGLFPTGAYDLPSADNPRLAGGMHWTAEEYLDFLVALHEGELLGDELRGAMLSNQRGDATVVASPALNGWGEDWSYGFGNWLECGSATGGANSYDCGSAGERNSSAGAYGAYPLIDAQHGYVAMLARQGGLATGTEGVALFDAVAPWVERWATGTCM